MKLISLVVLFSLVQFSWTSAMAAQECSLLCKAAILDTEFESAYHSGASSTIMADMVFEACGYDEKIAGTCSELINQDEGTITYLFYAGCVVEAVKKKCEDAYHANRNF